MFTDLADKRQKERTNEIVDIIEGYRKIEFPELTTNQLLGYLIFRENRQGNKEVSELGKKLFEEKVFKVDAFTTEEAIAFKHNLTLSREQMRKTRYVLQDKKVYFPTSNELNAARKNLRLVVTTTLSNKGVKVDYKELIRKTTSSVLGIVTEEGKFQRKNHDQYKMFF